MGNIVSRSLLARLVPQDELGKIYGLLAILDALLPFTGKSYLFLIIFCMEQKMTPDCQKKQR